MGCCFWKKSVLSNDERRWPEMQLKMVCQSSIRTINFILVYSSQPNLKPVLQYIDQEKTLEAIAAFKTAINLKNDHVGAWMNQALLLEKSGNQNYKQIKGKRFVQEQKGQEENKIHI